MDFMYISASAPDAPPLSETTIGCFIRLFFWIAACIIRAIWSEAPPAPAATTISTGLVGSQAAIAGALASMAVSATVAFRMFRTCFFPMSLFGPATAHGLLGRHCAGLTTAVQAGPRRPAYDFRMRFTCPLPRLCTTPAPRTLSACQERPAPARAGRYDRLRRSADRARLRVTPAWTVATVIADACVPSALKYSVWFAESKWNTAPDPEN